MASTNPRDVEARYYLKLKCAYKHDSAGTATICMWLLTAESCLQPRPRRLVAVLSVPPDRCVETVIASHDSPPGDGIRLPL